MKKYRTKIYGSFYFVGKCVDTLGSNYVLDNGKICLIAPITECELIQQNTINETN